MEGIGRRMGSCFGGRSIVYSYVLNRVLKEPRRSQRPVEQDEGL